MTAQPDQYSRKKVTIYIAATGTTEVGPGGWGSILEFGPHRKELSDFQPGTTLDRLAVFAAISGLGALKEQCDVTIVTTNMNLLETIRDGSATTKIGDFQFVLKVLLKKQNVQASQPIGDFQLSALQRCKELSDASMAEWHRLNTKQDE